MRRSLLSQISNGVSPIRNSKTNCLWALFVIFIDQVTKYFAPRQKILPIEIFENPGLPFGINLPGFFNLFLIVIGLLVFVFFYRKYFLKKSGNLGFALILGGALSNILDRLADGKVVDFINLGISTINLADIAIMVGIGYLVLEIRNSKHEIRNNI